MNRNLFLWFVAAVFGLMSLGHILRVVYGVTAVIGSWTVPIWMSWIALFFFAALCAWAVMLARGGDR